MALTPIQQDFAKFIADIWISNDENIDPPTNFGDDGCSSGIANGMFCHQYRITNHRSWNKWRSGNQTGTISQGIKFMAARQTHWWCQSLSEAAQHYSWTASTVGTFAGLATALQMAMNSNDQATTAKVCRNLFIWGGVARKPTDPSRLWIANHEGTGTLIANIQLAVKLLTPGCTAALTSFGSAGLLMNSAMTKIYAAANADIIIYDGRVGAALGLLTRLFLTDNGKTSVPSDLDFLWGASRTNPNSRDPSFDPYVFKSLNGYGIGDCDRAKIARIAGEVLSKTREFLNVAGTVVTMHELEKALFMVGYKVR